MPGKPQHNKYGEFRNCVEQMRKRKVRVRREFVPSLVAFVLALSQQFSKALEALGSDWLDDAEHIQTERYYRTGLKVCQHICNILDQNLSADAWEDACLVVAERFGISPTDTGPAPDAVFGPLFAEVAPDALPHEDRGAGSVQQSTGTGEESGHRDKRTPARQKPGGHNSDGGRTRKAARPRHKSNPP